MHTQISMPHNFEKDFKIYTIRINLKLSSHTYMHTLLIEPRTIYLPFASVT